MPPHAPPPPLENLLRGPCNMLINGHPHGKHVNQYFIFQLSFYTAVLTVFNKVCRYVSLWRMLLSVSSLMRCETVLGSSMSFFFVRNDCWLPKGFNSISSSAGRINLVWLTAEREVRFPGQLQYSGSEKWSNWERKVLPLHCKRLDLRMAQITS